MFQLIYTLVTCYMAYKIASHLKILIPVSTAIIIVADVKYACVFYTNSEYVMCSYYKS